MSLGDGWRCHCPLQIGTLRQLEQLKLEHIDISPFDNHELECLTALASLRRLSLVSSSLRVVGWGLVCL